MSGLRITIRDGAGPPYLQLYERLRALIERGSLLPGERLPTVRSLAEQLDLAPNTVARGYRALEDDGWIVGRGRAGTFVGDRLPERPAAPYLRRAEQLGFDRAAAARAVRSA
jgi:DNA-binding transcriptional regulator YhcF (GntR family)